MNQKKKKTKVMVGAWGFTKESKIKQEINGVIDFSNKNELEGGTCTPRFGSQICREENGEAPSN